MVNAIIPEALAALKELHEAANLSELESIHIVSPGWEHMANVVTAPDKPCFAFMVRKDAADWLAAAHNAFPGLVARIAELEELIAAMDANDRDYETLFGRIAEALQVDMSGLTTFGAIAAECQRRIRELVDELEAERQQAETAENRGYESGKQACSEVMRLLDDGLADFLFLDEDNDLAILNGWLAARDAGTRREGAAETHLVDMIRRLDPENLCDWIDEPGAEAQLRIWMTARDTRMKREGAAEVWAMLAKTAATSNSKIACIGDKFATLQAARAREGE